MRRQDFVLELDAPENSSELRLLLARRRRAVAFRWRGLQVTAGLGEAGSPSELHIAVSRPERDPTWEELKAVRYTFWPRSAEVVQFLPPPEEYVNIHDHCFHMHGDIDGQRRWALDS